MYWADTIGVSEVYRQIQAWHLQYGERWAPAALLRRLDDTGTPLREAKPGRPMWRRTQEVSDRLPPKRMDARCHDIL